MKFICSDVYFLILETNVQVIYVSMNDLRIPRLCIDVSVMEVKIVSIGKITCYIP